MSKNLYIIQDAIGSNGTQLASSAKRAVQLYIERHPGADLVGEVTAFAMNGMDGTERTYGEGEAA